MNKKQEDFLKLYEPVHDRFERFCRARVFGDMDYRDILNDSLVIAYEKFDTLKSNDAFLSFLFSICVRVVGNSYQKKRETRLEKDHFIAEISDKTANPQAAADIHYLYQALARLTADQRECIILFEISGFSIREIMEIQSSSESAVKQRLKRGREKLVEFLTYDASLMTQKMQHG